MYRPQNQKGISHLLIPIIVLVVAFIGFVGYKVATGGKDVKVAQTAQAPPQNTQSTPKSTEPVRDSWEFDGSTWKPTGKPPACKTPLVHTSPVDMKAASAILYPGQVRGQYKAHGGFHFSNKTNEFKVVMPIDGRITAANRYYEKSLSGTQELQYLVTFLNDCGIAIKFDHLLTLSPEVQAIMDQQPEPKLNDTRSLPIKGGKLFKEGDLIATAVGTKSDTRAGMDFGVYDYRQPNAASKNAAYVAQHQMFPAQDLYAICWLNELPAQDKAIAKSLPGGDGKMGKTSDYCK